LFRSRPDLQYGGPVPAPTDTDAPDAPLSGRRAQAARNDGAILEAARRVFLRDANAPIAAVATEAGVGVGALYRRYASKEVLLQTLCRDGLLRFAAIAEEAEAAHDDPGDALDAFIRGIVDADVHSLTVHLAGTFSPTAELGELAGRTGRLAERLFRRARAAGALRADAHLNDIVMIFEQLAAVRIGDADRTRALRRRYLAFHLDALRPAAATGTAPGRPPTAAELGERWRPRA
jgi:AcrR family transcriptional regulator